MKWAVGPGATRHASVQPKEVVIDYYQVAAGKVSSWPDIKQNSSGLSRLVYDKMQDFMARRERARAIGRAAKKGKTWTRGSCSVANRRE